MAFLIAAKASVFWDAFKILLWEGEIWESRCRMTSGSFKSISVIACAYRRYNIGAFVLADAVVVFFNKNLPVGLTSFRTESKESGVWEPCAWKSPFAMMWLVGQKARSIWSWSKVEQNALWTSDQEISCDGNTTRLKISNCIMKSDLGKSC